MSVVVKGMKMPKHDGEILCIDIYPDGTVCMDMDLKCRKIAEAIEIPPHGRLIDESDVMKSAEELRKSPWYNDEPYHAMRKDGFEMAIDMAVKDAPTVIEAEGVKE